MQLCCIFWNTGTGAPEREIIGLAAETGANFIALAEYSGDAMKLLRALNSAGLPFYSIPAVGCDRIRMFTRFEPNRISPRREANHYTINALELPGMLPLTIGVVHLQSKLHGEMLDQTFAAHFFKTDVEQAEEEAGHRNTLIFGDFNMDPFDNGMMAAAALNAVPSLQTADRGMRTIKGRNHLFFYNPTWNLLGDFEGPPGTYFHRSPGDRSHYWTTLDQVILRPSLAKRFSRESFAILTSAGEQTLISPKGRPTVSDHFPIVFALDLKQVYAQ